ncbi:MAG: helix-turn-helix domain-containing protein, partial [Kiritimatiellia bacterium]|nr:helix-turn-helix domain-containing protein [Kiritimatiellia bacterium]
MKKIADMIARGESETVEFKTSFNKDVIETAVAFANHRGGTILIGVSDDGGVIGQLFGKEALRDYVNRVAVATEPSIIPDAEKHSTSAGEIIILSITEFPLKPVATQGRCYRRSGSTTRQMTPSEIAEMHLHSTGQSMDAVIVARKSRDDLDLDAVRDYMRRATAQGRRTFAEQDDPWLVLKKLELVKSESEITRAAILLFGKNPQSPLTQAVVHAGRLREKVHIMDNRIIEGSIIEQVEETVEFIKRNLHVRFEITGEPQRKEIWDYPLMALREATVNAICHRDYGDTADIQIKIFEEALQIWSPGFLPFNMTIEDLFNPEHTSKPRNKLIAQIFYDIGLIERYGSGIRRILKACQEANLPEPLFENFSGGFRIKFMLPNQGSPQGDDGVGTLNGTLNGALNGTLNDRIGALIKKQPGIKRK